MSPPSRLDEVPKRGLLELTIEIVARAGHRDGVAGDRFVQLGPASLRECCFDGFSGQLGRWLPGALGLALQSQVDVFVERNMKILTPCLHAPKYAIGDVA